MNLTQIIVYKNQDQQSFVFFNTKAQSAHTCVAVLTPDSLIVKYFMTCIPDFFLNQINKKIRFFFFLKIRLNFFFFLIMVFSTLHVC